MIDLVQHADFIYESVNNFQGKVGLSIAGTNLLGTNFPSTNDSDTFLNGYATYLGTGYGVGLPAFKPVRGAGMFAADDTCLNHLFTHNTFAMGVIGLAQVGAPGYIGGLCSTYAGTVNGT